jgi:hypothetical protein
MTLTREYGGPAAGRDKDCDAMDATSRDWRAQTQAGTNG